MCTTVHSVITVLEQIIILDLIELLYNSNWQFASNVIPSQQSSLHIITATRWKEAHAETLFLSCERLVIVQRTEN